MSVPVKYSVCAVDVRFAAVAIKIARLGVRQEHVEPL
jgi:hypothetical protein